MSRPTFVPVWLIPVVAIVAFALSTAALTLALAGRGTSATPLGMMGGPAAMMPGGSAGMMAGGTSWMMGGVGQGSTAQPGTSGFVAGTAVTPRVVRVTAGPGYAFSPSTIVVARGETVTFVVTTIGPAVHEFMVGPAEAVAADQAGTPEIADIGMMQTKALTFTFDGPGPYAFACHAAGHYEAGMRGTITVVG